MEKTNSNNNATFSGINYDTTDNKFAVAHGVEILVLRKLHLFRNTVFSTCGMTASEAILNFKTSCFCNGGYGEMAFI
jgi:hypothetical protein